MLPSPQALAIAIAQTSFTLQEKRDMVASLPKFTEAQIIELYDLLVLLYNQETKLINDVKLLDLKYQTKVQVLMDEAKAAMGKKNDMETYRK